MFILIYKNSLSTKTTSLDFFLQVTKKDLSSWKLSLLIAVQTSRNFFNGVYGQRRKRNALCWDYVFWQSFTNLMKHIKVSYPAVSCEFRRYLCISWWKVSQLIISKPKYVHYLKNKLCTFNSFCLKFVFRTCHDQVGVPKNFIMSHAS